MDMYSPPVIEYNYHKFLVIFGLILVILITLLSVHIYYNNNNDVIKFFSKLFEKSKNIGAKFDLKTSLGEIKSSTEIKTKKNSLPITEKKEVFNIDNNDFTYNEAKLMCKSLDSKLATYQQVVDAYENGANWCNYGWSESGLALYPTQEEFWKKLQDKGGKHRHKCGKPGVNGGVFPDKSLRFGVNCYGYKPKPDKSKINYLNSKYNIDQKIIKKYKKKFKEGIIELKPFNTSNWSEYSKKKSRYINTPKYDEDFIMEKEIEKIEDDPYNYK